MEAKNSLEVVLRDAAELVQQCYTGQGDRDAAKQAVAEARAWLDARGMDATTGELEAKRVELETRFGFSYSQSSSSSSSM